MRNVNLRVSLWLIVALSGVAWFSFAYFGGVDLSKLPEFLGLLPKVVTVDLITIAVFVKWLWRCKWLRGWLVPFPDLNGTWLGEIRSDWVDERTGKKIPPIPAMLTVRQTFFHISCVMQTEEMRSDSYVEGFRIDDERQVRQLAYSYQSRPRLSVQQRSAPHDGTIVFEVIESGERKLRGRYWTERKTTGEIEFRFYSSAILEELPSGVGQHPMTRDTEDR
jgi:hypothetical protein